MIRTSQFGELIFDPEVEKTAKQLRKLAKQARQISSTSEGVQVPRELSWDSDLDSNSENETIATRTLKELAAPDLNQQLLCIQYPALNVAFELKSGLIHLLPTFHGLVGEDPHKHLKEFHVVCSSMKPQGVSEDQIKLRAFPFSLEDTAKDWLYYLPSGSVNSWNGMKQIFLENYFLASCVANIRKEICGIRQYNGESLYEHWEQIKKLCERCPHHQISEQLLIQYFYEGLLPMDRSMIDTASGGALVDKTPEEAKRLIDNMAANSQQFGMRMDHAPKKVNEVSTSDLEKQISDLTSLVRQLAVGNMQTVKVCGICSGSGHATDMCPTLQEDESMQHANAVGNYGQHAVGDYGRPQRRYDPFSNTYNLGCKLEAQGSGKLPSQTVMNPRENASAILLQTGKEIDNQTPHEPIKKKKQRSKRV
ncbi:hypothetical protein P3X46_012212 [Hevea brasiliensis]|uniref:Retrotransposon gag domain-containing protein n=1 Tax=Hevea brasiliensis TaxID=3981 RepID=A0ABQ9M9L5_HEVBR|nr:hypothetical protein P3X46_012212 [Hevea brasiliensis]